MYHRHGTLAGRTIPGAFLQKKDSGDLTRCLKATEGIRTPDLLITNQLLYRLSHVGIAGEPARLIIIAQLPFYVY